MHQLFSLIIICFVLNNIHLIRLEPILPHEQNTSKQGDTWPGRKQMSARQEHES